MKIRDWKCTWKEATPCLLNLSLLEAPVKSITYHTGEKLHACLKVVLQPDATFELALPPQSQTYMYPARVIEIEEQRLLP